MQGFDDFPVEELKVPDTFATSFACCTEDCTTYFPEECMDQDAPWGRRAWVVDLFDMNGKTWAIFMAAGPAALGFILVFAVVFALRCSVVHGSVNRVKACQSRNRIVTRITV